MSPYNYDEKITVEDDDEQHETTTVPASTTLKSVHRFQSIDFLVGLKTPHLPIKTRKSSTENNQANTIDAVVVNNNVRPILHSQTNAMDEVVANNSVRPILHSQTNTMDAVVANNNVRPLLLKCQRKPLIIKRTTINRLCLHYSIVKRQKIFTARLLNVIHIYFINT